MNEHAAADLTSWIEYFIRLLAKVFTAAREETLRSAEDGITLEPEAIRLLDPRARQYWHFSQGWSRLPLAK